MMTLQQFRFLYRVMTGQVEPREHIFGHASPTSRALRKNGWLELDSSWHGTIEGAYVTEAGLEEMKKSFPEFFTNHGP